MIDTKTNGVLKGIMVGKYSFGIAVVANQGSTSTSVIDGTTNNLVSNVKVGRFLGGIGDNADYIFIIIIVKMHSWLFYR